jgi:hypothetical protein
MLNLGDVLQQRNIGQLQVGVLEPALRKQVFDPFLGLARIDAVADGYSGTTFSDSELRCTL